MLKQPEILKSAGMTHNMRVFQVSSQGTRKSIKTARRFFHNAGMTRSVRVFSIFSQELEENKQTEIQEQTQG